ncbi:MAG TPA: ABC transporter transmembrane domain-containing protein [Stellaceae bacterium]|nr:ABC transporter transmembrane domain-containing protein [Stellaceae bacterium]
MSDRSEFSMKRRRGTGLTGPSGNIVSLRLLWPFFRPYRIRAILAWIALLLAALLVLGVGQGVKALVDDGLKGGGMAQLNRASIEMFIVIAAFAATTCGRYYLVSWLGERVTADIRRAIFDRVIGLSPEFFETARTGELLSRLSADTSVLQAVVTSTISQWLRNAVMMVGAAGFLFWTSPRLASFVVAIVPVMVVPMVAFGRRERRLSRAAQDRVGEVGAYAEETINSIRTVQAFNHQTVDREKFAATVETSVETTLTRVRSRSILILVIILLGFGAITAGMWYGGREVLEGRMTGGELSAFLFYAVLMSANGAAVAELWGDMKRAAGAAERLVEILAERPTIVAPAVPAPLPVPPQGRLEFQEVVFSYPARPDRSALAGLSFSVEPGETVALVGPSGAGKSTVFQLALRFYDPQKGRILLDGVDLRDADPVAVRARLGLVPQEPVIFSANAWDNIRYGRPDATDDEVRAAAVAAHATEFLDRLPDGFDTFLGEKGVRLSGGQRQRIAIARAVLRNPPILLLDEATSSLDAHSERAVQEALAELSEGRTMLVIAHRLATVRRANRIIVLERGKVISTGTHEALVRQGGLYAELASLQFADIAA